VKTFTWLLVVVVAVLAFGNLVQWRSDTSEDAAIKAFRDVWVDHIGIYQESRWLGVETLQNPTDAWITQEIIQEVKPDFIVEAGTYKGGSALLWAMVLKEVNPRGRVITIDIEDQVTAARTQAIWGERIDFLVGGSTDPAIFAEVKRRVEGGRVLVILDSLHTRDHVKAELGLYSPLVNKGSYIIVQDTGIWKPSPQKSWASEGVRLFLAANKAFVVDRKRERFLVTNNPRGYLKRVR
jgi:cephalosporin hydroxylase